MEGMILKVMMADDEVGRLYWDENRQIGVFTYHPDFVRKGVDIAPLTASIYSSYGKGMSVMGIPPKKDAWYKGLPPFLADSLPDKWGEQLFDIWTKSQKIELGDLTPVDRLAFVGKRAMGAFWFVPDAFPWGKGDTIQLDRLCELAERIYRMRQDVSLNPEEEGLLAGLVEVGTSAGGRHSKAVIAIHNVTGMIRSGQTDLGPDYTQYLLKFAEGCDFPSSHIEYAYSLMAEAAGINIMPCKLYSAGGKMHFLTERFDRQNGERIHTQSLAAMRPGADSYEDLMNVAAELNIPANEKQQLFRRMVFNLMAGNTDDHIKNFSFMMDKQGKWHITPAYDLTFTVDFTDSINGGRHAMTVMGRDEKFDEELLITFAKRQGVKNAEEIIRQVCMAVSQFYKYAELAGVNRFAIDRIEQYLANIMPEKYGRTMIYHKPIVVNPYWTEGGMYISGFKIKETNRRDFELWCVIDDKQYRIWVNGETEEAKAIREDGGIHMSEEKMKVYINRLMIPHVQYKRELRWMARVSNISINEKNEICCKIDGVKQHIKKLKQEDWGEDPEDIVLKYYKDELIQSDRDREKTKGYGR